MKRVITVDGNEACSRTAYLFTELSGIYPITPSSPMAEHMDEWSSHHETNLFGDTVKVVEMQSEAGAAGLIHGALQAGTLATTFTASQGLLLMIPNMYKIAGEMLPCVMHVAARSLSTHALSIFGDHQDIYATRATGFAMLASSNVQDAGYLSAVAHLSAIEASLPFLHFFDGFRTSHEIQKIEVLEKEDYASLLNQKALMRFRKKALQPNHPVTRGTNQNDDIYFQMMEAKNNNYNELPDIVASYMEKINQLAGTNYAPFCYYGSPNAEKVIVAMGSVCDTIKETIDHLEEEVGLIEVHLYRPFSAQYLKKVLPSSVKKVAVLDRTKEAGSSGEPLYLDVLSVLKDTCTVVGGRYGLSSKNTTPAQIKAVYDMLDNPKNPFTIGIEDDVTHLSLQVDHHFRIDDADEFLIYGYGSDGMVSAGKSLIQMMGDCTSQFVQGYFEYDSKKSGGVTIGHLRFSKSKIRKPYYVENPKVVVVTKDSYLSEFELFTSIRENGICLIETSKSEEELLKMISSQNQRALKDKNIEVYYLNAGEIARTHGLKNKISMIMEKAIIEVSHMIDSNQADQFLKNYITHKFFKKGEEVIQANLNSLSAVESSIHKFQIETYPDMESITHSNIYEAMQMRKGNDLKVSDFLENKDGTFMRQTAGNERGISEFVPKWLNESCIQCNQCSFVCPHGVIRPYLLSEQEYQEAPDIVKSKCVKPIHPKLKDYYYLVAISIKNCTGCGVCVSTCPGMKGSKALSLEQFDKQNLNQEQEIFDYVSSHITNKQALPNSTVVGSQLEQPKFAFCGACAGCGETAYIKLLTQLFPNQIVIANATGCSSIYGGSAPSFPYDLPWASSLFEDNAEYGYGMLMGNKVIHHQMEVLIEQNQNHETYPILKRWITCQDDYEACQIILHELEGKELPDSLKPYSEYLLPKTIWTIGGDGWAYDIGFGGIDHVLSSNDDVNILVLDSQVYSNTGGQSSKASPKGAIASFATSGKQNAKKDLARMLLAYPHVYVATVSLGANMMQLIKVLKEAAAYKGPSIVIAYTPCISHGIEGGMENSVSMEKLATECGYFPIFHYHPETKKFYLDSKEPDFSLYRDFLQKQTRYKMLTKINPEEAESLLKSNQENAKARYDYYKMLSEQS